MWVYLGDAIDENPAFQSTKGTPPDGERGNWITSKAFKYDHQTE